MYIRKLEALYGPFPGDYGHAVIGTVIATRTRGPSDAALRAEHGVAAGCTFIFIGGLYCGTYAVCGCSRE